jgi:hypothetical protein
MLDGLTLNEHSQIELSKCKIYLKNIKWNFDLLRFFKKNTKNSLIIILFLNILSKIIKKNFKINIHIILSYLELWINFFFTYYI